MTAQPSNLPREQLLARLVTRVADEPRCIALLGAGSLAAGTMDEHSDLDLVLVAAPGDEQALVAVLPTLAAESGALLSAFSGDHVGERRLLICLFGPPLVHVDLKAVGLADLAHRVDANVVLWSRDARAADRLAGSLARYPMPEPQWIEDRFWTWIHYGCARAARGELFEVLDLLALLRGRVLGPLALQQAGAQPNGVRRLEQRVPDVAAALAATATPCEPRALLRALRHCVAAYRELRARGPAVTERAAAEAAVVRHLEAMATSLGADA